MLSPLTRPPLPQLLSRVARASAFLSSTPTTLPVRSARHFAAMTNETPAADGKMRAARYYGRGDIRVERVPVPELKPGTVAIDVAYSGICGSDLHEYIDGPIFCPVHPHPFSREQIPVTLGHEFSGRIAAVGEGVSDLTVGEGVCVEPYILDPAVDTSAKNNTYHLSKGMGFIGLSGGGGGLSERVVVPRRWVHPVADMALDEAALIEPLCVAHHAFMRSGAKPGDTALVTGAGPIGLLTAAICKAKGVRAVVSETSELRRRKALETGVAEAVFDPREVDVAAALRKDGGADVGFECTSVQVAFDTLIDALRPAGTVVVLSIWGHKAQLDMQKLVLKEINVKGTIAYANDHPEVIRLVQEGKIDLRPFITKVIGLDELVTDGFDTLINRNDTAVKILVDPRK